MTTSAPSARRVGLAVVLTTALALGCAGPAWAASAEREPNDTLEQAAANHPPLAGGQSWSGLLGDENDSDLWPLYAAPGHHQVTLVLTNTASASDDGPAISLGVFNEDNSPGQVTVPAGGSARLPMDIEGPASYLAALNTAWGWAPGLAYTLSIEDPQHGLVNSPDTVAAPEYRDAGLKVKMTSSKRTFTLRVALAKGAQGDLKVTVKRGRKMVPVRTVSKRRLYRFTLQRYGTYRVAVRFTGRAGYLDDTWATPIIARHC